MLGEQDLLLPVAGHIVFTTVAGQGWLAGQIALSGCNAAFSSRNLLRQCLCEPIFGFPSR
jgi:hypothetical protein